MSTPGPVVLISEDNRFWRINSKVQSSDMGSSGVPSTNTMFAISIQNSSIVDIVGIKYERV